MSYSSLYSPYGTLSLTDGSPQQSWTEPVTSLDVQAFVQWELPADQAALVETVYIPAAREQAEILQNRDLVLKQYDLSMDYWPYGMVSRQSYFPAGTIELRPHLVSVDLLRYRDSAGAYTTLVENTDYVVDTAKQPGVIAPAYNATWPSFTPWPSSAIMARFTAGVAAGAVWWNDAGSRVKTGMLLLISAWVNNRLPFMEVRGQLAEYPFGVRECMSYGRLESVR